MSNNKAQSDELKRQEDEAYFELCQIIAEAMQFQDVELLNARIASWKIKYKNLLSGAASANFKKRIEFLLTEYYSSVTQYILSQIKFKEEKQIENQAKALRELYVIIRDTDDLPLLKKKVDEWKSKYPVHSFLNMYQKKIASYTRQKNLEQNAFDQDKAFCELIDITKKHLTFNELKQELLDWEKIYSINDKYNIDDFIKHQSEVKRFTSDEYLISIGKDLNIANTQNIAHGVLDDLPTNTSDSYNNKFSGISKQDAAYTALVAVSKKHDNINEIFNWVYKNSSIKFNDKYKELILSATYLDYSPTYLNSLSAPKINISDSSLSFEEYRNIDEIKRYAVISYFNLLLPPDKAISNNYFNKHIETIYRNSNRKHNLKNKVASINELDAPVLDVNVIMDIQEVPSSKDKVLKKSISEIIPEPILETKEEPVIEAMPEPILETKEELVTKTLPEPILETREKPVTEITDESIKCVNKPSIEESDEIQDIQEIDADKPVTYNTIVAFSPQFFTEIYNLSNQAVLVNQIDKSTTKYVSLGTPALDKSESRNINN